jgi:hypothetical protein
MAREHDCQQKRKRDEQEFVQEMKKGAKQHNCRQDVKEVSRSSSPASASVTVSWVNDKKVNAVLSTQVPQQNMLSLEVRYRVCIVLANGGCEKCYVWECAECLAHPSIPQKTAEYHEEDDDTVSEDVEGRKPPCPIRPFSMRECMCCCDRNVCGKCSDACM